MGVFSRSWRSTPSAQCGKVCDGVAAWPGNPDDLSGVDAPFWFRSCHWSVAFVAAVPAWNPLPPTKESTPGDAEVLGRLASRRRSAP